MKKLSYSLLIFIAANVQAQNPSSNTVSLEDMSSFKPNIGNWFIVGKVTVDRRLEEPDPESPSAIKEDRRTQTLSTDHTDFQPIRFENGKGILLNLPSKNKHDQLVTVWEHGDIELELELMIPKGSNSGIYMQGGYEIQILDSWGVNKISAEGMGGIYRNWEAEPEKMYLGKPPLANASKAPGLWQKLKVVFKAPRFNNKGEKVANARFVSVMLNGVKIHDNVEVPKLTGGPLDNREKALGPLMIQGDHGAIAVRNIRYRLLKESDISLTDMSFKVFHGNFEAAENFLNKKPDRIGKTLQPTYEVAGADNYFGIIFNGSINIHYDENYRFNLAYNGRARLTISDSILPINSANNNNNDTASLFLKKGTYPFQLLYYKNLEWQLPRLGLIVSGESSYPKTLSTYNSYPPGEDVIAPIRVSVGNEPRLLRGFLDFKGDQSRRLTHTIAVGDPCGLHYIYDLQAGNLICVWRGDFIDATRMWHGSGDGSFVPVGVLQYLFSGPALTILSDSSIPFPSVSNEKDFHGDGYAIDNRPIFMYNYKGVEVSDKIYPDSANNMLTREISFKNFNLSSAYIKLAEGSAISQTPDGSYAIDDNNYYIEIAPRFNPSIREQAGKKELIVGTNGTPIKYSITW